MKKVIRVIVSGLGALALNACGGSDSSASLVENASPGGIWQGTDPISGLALYGIIAETGEAHFLRSDGAQFFGVVTTSWNSLSGSYDGILAAGFVFADGSNHGTGTVSGTIQARQAMTATIDFTTAGGTSSSGTGSLSFNALYDSGSSLATIAGNYLDPSSNTIVNVNGYGVVFAQDPNTGCVVNGQISIINSQYDAYQVQYSFSSCRGSATYLNNTTATGLGVLDTSVNPAVAYIGVVNSGANYVLTAAYTRQ